MDAAQMGCLAWQKQLASESSKVISRGLDLDMTSPSQAVQFYRRGAQLIRQALSIDYPPGEKAQAKPLEEKMQRNLALVEERLQALEERRKRDPHLHAVFAPTYQSSAPTTQPELLPQSTNPYAAAATAYQQEYREQQVGGQRATSAYTVTSVPMRYTPPRVQQVVPYVPTPAPAAASVPQSSQMQRTQRQPQTRSQSAIGQKQTQAATAQTVRRPHQSSAPAMANGRPQATANRSSSGDRMGVSVAKTKESAAAGTSAGKAMHRDERIQRLLKGIDKDMQTLILREIVDDKPGVSWDDVAGLEEAKQCLMEMVILPALRPDIFSGLRSPPKGLLLFGPPGNGKTMLAKAVATESNCTFFSISASSLVSKYVGDSEKLVRALFAIAKVLQPSIVFIDEMDTLVPARRGENQSGMARLETELLVQMEGVGTLSGERVVVMGATNRPQDVDSAARRRLQKRVYIPLPNKVARLSIVKNLLKGQKHALSSRDMSALADETDGYSGADLSVLCTEAALEPIRELGKNVANVSTSKIRPISIRDFRSRLRSIKPSVDPAQLRELELWNEQFGSSS